MKQAKKKANQARLFLMKCRIFCIKASKNLMNKKPVSAKRYRFCWVMGKTNQRDLLVVVFDFGDFFVNHKSTYSFFADYVEEF